MTTGFFFQDTATQRFRQVEQSGEGQRGESKRRVNLSSAGPTRPAQLITHLSARFSRFRAVFQTHEARSAAVDPSASFSPAVLPPLRLTSIFPNRIPLKLKPQVSKRDVTSGRQALQPAAPAWFLVRTRRQVERGRQVRREQERAGGRTQLIFVLLVRVFVCGLVSQRILPCQ